jgi:hypothetical protein
VITDDVTAWHEFPESRWMFDKLYVQQELGAKCGPVGIDPTEFPVYVKPIMNLYGMGINSYKAYSLHEVEYVPGMMWMESYVGTHKSHDIRVVDRKCEEVYTAIGENPPNFLCWRVDAGDKNEGQYFVNKLVPLGKLPEYINVETINNEIIEVHPRWSAEFYEYYDQLPFRQEVLWSYDFETEVPKGWIDCRVDSCNLMKKLKRIAYRYRFES